ncbi:uncharacterized protein E5676_scaffold35G003180 [Cucumis melo var. makuwa]|uniref:Uncharacterized protein n=1 Tax=Cucumis melo var. makuwa TaxID=1194695 RepID=A0A5D3CXY6_CUCMM|nr:uncharacterized protein E5676_scaffold35G003180 [Cucumis melo var. makuwa]
MLTPPKLTNGNIPCVAFPDSIELQSKSISRASPPVLSPPEPNKANDPLKSEDDFSNHETEELENSYLLIFCLVTPFGVCILEQYSLFIFLEKVLDKLRRYGLSGILSYGLLNTAYYLTTFLVVWFYIAPAPAKMGYVAAAGRFLKIMATVWAGSQVTKLARAAGALALAPFVDRGLSWFTVNYNFESQGKAFMAIVGFCLGLALLLFIVVTLLSA